MKVEGFEEMATKMTATEASRLVIMYASHTGSGPAGRSYSAQIDIDPQEDESWICLGDGMFEHRTKDMLLGRNDSGEWWTVCVGEE